MTLREYKLSYGSTIDTVSIDTKYIDRRKAERTVVRETPSGAKYKQVFGTGKVAWTFTFPYSDADLLAFFQNGYDAAVDGNTLTLSEYDGISAFDEYTVIINLPSFNDDVFGATPIYQDVSIEVYEA